MTKQSPSPVENFDKLSDANMLRVGHVAAIVGASVPSIWRWAKEGRLAQPVRLGRRVTAWRVGDVRKFLQGAA